MKLNALLLVFSVTAVLAFPINFNSRLDEFSPGEFYMPLKSRLNQRFLRLTNSDIAKRDIARLVGRPEYDGGKVKSREEEDLHLVERPDYHGGKVKARSDEDLHLVERPEYSGG